MWWNDRKRVHCGTYEKRYEGKKKRFGRDEYPVRLKMVMKTVKAIHLFWIDVMVILPIHLMLKNVGKRVLTARLI